MNQISYLETWLFQKNVKVGREWLQACLEYILEELTTPTINVLRDEVYKQWISGDLSEMGCQSLPPKITSIHKIMLTGKYILQVNSVRDISQPAYSQLLKVKGDSGQENIDVSAAPKEAEPIWQAKPNRMLYLEVTDGKQDLNAMEYKPVPALNLALCPGTKVLVSGPVECRMGVLLLVAKCVQVLGGEVQGLAAINSQEQVLSRTLHLQFDATQILIPRATTQQLPPDDEPLQRTNANRNPNEGISQTTVTRSNNISEGSSGIWTRTTAENSRAVSNNMRVENPSRNRSSRSSEDAFPESDDEDDELFNSIDVNALTQSTTSLKPLHEEHQNTIEINDFEDDFDFEAAEKCLEDEMENLDSSHINLEVKEQPSNLQVASNKISSSSSRTSFAQVFPEDRSGPAQLRKTNPDTRASTVITQLSDIHVDQLVGASSPASVTIKGFLTSVISPLTLHRAEGWQLRAKVNDGSMSMDVDFADNVLADLVGSTAKEVQDMTVRASENPELRAELKKQINEGMDRCRQALLKMNGFMKLQIGHPRPVLIKYLSGTDE